MEWPEEAGSKIRVGVLALIRPEGSVTPLKLLWEDGRAWDIDQVLSVQPGAAHGCTGLRFVCRIGRCERVLWQAGGQWFVERKNPAGPAALSR